MLREELLQRRSARSARPDDHTYSSSIDTVPSLKNELSGILVREQTDDAMY